MLKLDQTKSHSKPYEQENRVNVRYFVWAC